MLHTGGQYKSRKIITDDILSLLVLFLILYFLHKGLQETEDYKWRHFFIVIFFFMFHTGWQYKSQKVINDDNLLLLVFFFILYFQHKGLQEQEGYKWWRFLTVLLVTYLMPFMPEGRTRVGRLLMTTFAHCSLWYLFYASYRWAVQESEGYKLRHFLTVLFVTYFILHTGGQYKRRKIINDEIFSLFFFVIYFYAFLQVGSTRVRRL